MVEKGIAIGADIGGGHIVCAAIDLDMGAILKGTTSHAKVNNKGSKGEIIDTWAGALNATISMIDRATPAGIGFAMPGAFNYKEGVAMFEGNDKYEALYNVYIPEELNKKIQGGELPMRFQNDATSFGVGVSWIGVGKDFEKVISITLGTGFGSAFTENGIPIVHRDDVPDQGCFWHLPYKDGIADDYFSTRWFTGRYSEITGNEAPGVKEVAEEAALNQSVRKIFDEFGSSLGDFLIPWIRKFPADAIVMGGNVTKAFELFAPSFKEVFYKKRVSAEIMVSRLMEDAALIGSARLFEEDYWQRVKDNLPEK